ncbi:MAG TPA: hypothetical protein VHV52_01305 [Gaiellaceae bacterium]|jgi:hypothetical protein|nr:hypothetical protein [Gaiellaceae bacterium]
MKKRILSALLATTVAGLVLAASAFAAAPSNTTAPSVSGTPKVGQTLTVSNGTWTGSPTSYSYRWQRCSSSTTCTTIANENGNSYVVRTADVNHTLRAVVTASNADGISTANSNQTAPVTAATGIPVNTAQPSISGDAIVGETLTAVNGTWSNSPTSYGYRWLQCDRFGGACVPTGFTGRHYTVQLADVGGTLRVNVTARNANGSATARSTRSDVVQAVPVVSAPADKAPTISFLSLRKIGTRVYARFRVCDDAAKAVEVVERSSKPGYLAYSRKYSVVPNSCVTATRSFVPVPRFRTKGHFTVTLTAIDKSGKASRSVSRSLRWK